MSPSSSNGFSSGNGPGPIGPSNNGFNGPAFLNFMVIKVCKLLIISNKSSKRDMTFFIDSTRSHLSKHDINERLFESM